LKQLGEIGVIRRVLMSNDSSWLQI